MKIEDTYFSLLRTSLWGTESKVGKEEIPGLVKIAFAQSTAGMVFDALLSCDVEIDPELSMKMKRHIARNILMHGTLDSSIAKVVTDLKGLGIEGVLLKGQGNAARYRRPELRACGDIDYYVGEANFMKAVQYASALAGEKEIQYKRIIGKHYDVDWGEVHLEIHRKSEILAGKKRDRIYQEYSDNGLREGLVPIDINGVSVMTPEPTFNAFYIFHHAWHHFSAGGVGMRHLCDFTTCIHAFRDRIDRERLEKMVKSLGLETPWKCFAYIAVEKLGLPAGEMPLYDSAMGRKGERLTRFILKDGNFGRGRKPFMARPGNYVLGKAYALTSHVARFLRTACISPHLACLELWFRIRHGLAAVFKDIRK